ncbi:MAG: hypothetical protein JRN52_10065 [Nitrososphaerota archaeon]|nr:hypothetical protein [Nitrososphaerota archaeon]
MTTEGKGAKDGNKPSSSGTLREQKRRMGYDLLMQGHSRAEVAKQQAPATVRA